MAPVLVRSFLWLEKESVEVDSELDQAQLGLDPSTDGPLPSLPRAGESRRVSGSASSMDGVKYALDKERDRRK